MATSTRDARGGLWSPRSRLLGSLSELRNDPLRLFTDAASSGQDVVRFRAAYRHVFLVVGPEAIARVGVDNRENYVKGVSYDALRVPMPDALLTIDGDAARERRRMLMPIFTRRGLLDEVPTVAAAVEALWERWDGFAADGTEVDLASEMNRLAFDVVGRILMGAELGEDMTELEALIADASAWVAHRTRELIPLPPSLPTPRNRTYARAYRGLEAFTDRLIASRREAERADVVSRLIHACDEGGRFMADSQLRYEVAGFLMAGHQTTAASLAWTWYLLARDPDAQERVAADARSVLNGGRPEPEQLELMPYLGRVLDESLRLYPPGWAFTRTPLAGDELSGVRVPKGSIVIISSYANQRSPRFWDDPARFDPGRFEPARRAAIEPYAYFPFGVGPHACIGKHMAEIESMVAMAMLARRYRVGLVSERPVPANPSITLMPGAPVMARIERRSG
jgi:cytochrome P450